MAGAPTVGGPILMVQEGSGPHGGKSSKSARHPPPTRHLARWSAEAPAAAVPYSQWRRAPERRPASLKGGTSVDWILATLFVLHVGGAIVAFGPTFAFPIIGSMGGSEPMHANFGIRVTERITQRIVLPLAVFQGITGLLLIWRAGFNPLTQLWL